MRRLITWNMVTLDGYFEGPKPWDIGWHELTWGEELERLSVEQTGAADMLLFGRVTYEGMAAYWPSAKGEVADIMNTIPKVVFSRTLERAAWNNTRLVREAADEYRLGLTPVVLGGGTPLFKPAPQSMKMKLLEARALQTGCVLLRYEPAP